MACLDDIVLSSEDGSSFETEGFLIHEREYDNFRSYINKNELNSETKTSTLLGLNRYIAKHFERWNDKKLVVGITGNIGVGKSRLINALRGLTAKDDGAAAVGVCETTKKVHEYNYTQNGRIVLMDFPGVGKDKFPKEEYMTKTKLLECGVVIIVTATRFTENDKWIAKQVLKVRKNVIFVRTKIDFDLSNAENDDPYFSEYKCITSIRKETEQRMDREDVHDLHEAIFLVSSRDNTKYDFDLLVAKLKCLSYEKGKSICSLLYGHMVKTIELKTKQYETEFTGKKIASAITGLLPIPTLESTLDAYHVSKMWEKLLKVYCIDKDSLTMIALETNESVKDLQSKLKSYESEISDGERLHTETEDRKWLFVEKYSKYLIPILGMFYSASKSPQTMQECLNKICRVMAGDEMMLVKFRLRKLEQDLIT